VARRLRQDDTGRGGPVDQLFARSLREIQAHAGEPAQTETGGFLINEAAQLLAALRLWAQTRYRSDQAVRDMLEALDVRGARTRV